MGQLDLNIFDHIMMIFLAIILPALAIMGPKRPFEDLIVNSQLKKSLYLNNSLFQWIGTAIVLVVWYFSGRSWSVLGFSPVQPDAHPLWIFLLSGFIILYIADAAIKLYWPGQRQLMLEKWSEHMPFIPTTWHEFKWWIIAAFSAGICEEIVFRGFMINYLLTILEGSTLSLLMALGIPALIFGIAHRYQGRSAVAKIVLMAFAFGLIFILTKSIVLLIVVHIIIDLAGGLIGIFIKPQFVTEVPARPEEE